MSHTDNEKRGYWGAPPIPIGIKLRRLPAEKQLLANSAVA